MSTSAGLFRNRLVCDKPADSMGRDRAHGSVDRMSQVITANRVRDGIVVFLGTDFSWVEQIGAARVFATAETAASGLVATKKDEADNLVLEVYAIDVSEKDGTIVPVRLREAIRATGPTIHPEHGKSPFPSRG